MSDIGRWAMGDDNLPEQPELPHGLHIASVKRRALGYIIDYVILVLINFALNAILYSAGIIPYRVLADNRTEYNVPVFVAISVLELIVSAVYFVYTWRQFRGSPGMRLLLMELGDERTGEALTYDRAVLRWLLLFLPASLISVVLAPLGELPAILGSSLAVLYYLALLATTNYNLRHQGLHDRAARDLVVSAV